MDAAIIGKISGALVLLSAIPYAIRTYQGKIKPNIIGWSLWAIIGLSILLNYISIGATDNIWPAFFGFINPLVITIIAIWKKNKLSKDCEAPNGDETKKRWEKTMEYLCVIFCFTSLLLWWLWQKDKVYAPYALYLAIAADAAAALPTIIFVWRNPNKDRPFAWFLFAVGYGLILFAIKNINLANYSVPIYMFLGSLIILIPLVKYRMKKNISLKNWI